MMGSKLVGLLLAVLVLGCVSDAGTSALGAQCRSVTAPTAVLGIVDGMDRLTSDAVEMGFMQSMVRFDAGAIGISKEAICKAGHPELRQFAQRVIDERSSEQERFFTWLLAQYGDDGIPSKRPMAGDWRTIGSIEPLCGCEFEVQYMLAMISHDAGVLAVASKAGQRSIHGRIGNAASGVAAQRSVDIARLQSWLLCWYGIEVTVVTPARCVC